MRNFSWLLWGASTAFLERDARPADAPATPPVEEAVERDPLRGASDETQRGVASWPLSARERSVLSSKLTLVAVCEFDELDC